MKKVFLFAIAIFISLTALTLAPQKADALPTDGFYTEFGILLGGGRPAVSTSNASIHDNWKLNGGLNASLGIPVSRKFVANFTASWLASYYGVTETTSKFVNNFNLLAGLDWYFYGPLFATAKLGFAYLKMDHYTSNTSSTLTSEPGWGIRLGIGYETRISRKFNFGVSFNYIHNFVYPSNLTVSYLGTVGNIFIRWH